MTAIDISYWQHHPDFAQVHASGVSLVIMKCGGGEGGSLYADSVYVANRAAARAEGLAVGSYFFNGPVDPVAAADFQFSIIDWQPGDVVAIDVENNGNQQHWNQGQVLAWCQRIISHGVPAHRVLVYMSAGLLSLGWDAVAGLGVGLWVAQYGPNDGGVHSTPGSGPWPSWSLWQHTSAKACPGIAGLVDTNIVSPSWASSSESSLTPIPDPIYAIGDTMKFAVINVTGDGSHLIGLRYGELTALYVDNATDPEEFAASELSLGSGSPRVYITQRQANIELAQIAKSVATLKAQLGTVAAAPPVVPPVVPPVTVTVAPIADADIARIVKAILDTESARLAN